MHMLGLNWQLQPADGHTFNNGIRTGLPGSEDVATMPSGGKGEDELHLLLLKKL